MDFGHFNAMAFSKHSIWVYVAVLGGVALAAVGGLWYWNETTPLPVAGEYKPFHAHVDVALYLNGEKIDLAQEKYMSTSERVLSKYVHLHDGLGNVVHFHAQNISLKTFLESLGFAFVDDAGCVLSDENVSLCANETRAWKIWVNGSDATFGFDYVPADLDRVLISFGNESREQLMEQFSTVTDEACIQSEKCPERGSPSPESSCAGSGECSVGYIPIGE